MLYNQLAQEHIIQLIPYIQDVVKMEVDKAMSNYSKLYEQDLKRTAKVQYSSIQELCIVIGKTRQQVYNWEMGKVQGLDISSFIKKTGRFKSYDIEGIKLYLEKLIDHAERFGSSRFSKRKV